MSRTRIVKGKITEITGGTSRVFGESIQINSNKRIDYFAQSYTYGEPKEPPVKILDGAVKEIELLTPLDLGSDNNYKKGVISKTQLGMIFGNSYEFRVKSYVTNPPTNLSDIKWMLKYHSLSQNKWLEIPLSVRGKSVTIKMNNKDMCGRFVFVRAYVSNPQVEGEYQVWKHNRFRWFDRKKVHEQIMDRVKDPWKINQGQSSLCGIAAIYYAMAKRDPQAYQKLAKELFRTGEYSIGTYIVKPHEKALSMYETKPTDSNYKSMIMPDIDWIVLATTRSKESLNGQFVYNGFENGDMDMLKAVNWPDMLTRMCKEVAGFTNAESFGLNLLSIKDKKGLEAKLHDYVSDSDLDELKVIDKKYNAGHTILMMIDSNMLEDIPDYNPLNLTTNSHWVVYEGGLNIIEVGDEKFVGFRIYTWGLNFNDNYKPESGNKTKEVNIKYNFLYNTNIDVKSFKSNYYGFIEIY